MRHKTAERWLSADLGGSLPPGRRRKLEAHLDLCPRCRSTRRAWENIRSRAAVEIPPDADVFWTEGLNRLRTALAKSVPVPVADKTLTRPVPGFFPWKRFAWGAGGMGVVAAAVLLFIVLAPGRPLEDSYAYALGNPGVSLEEEMAADEVSLEAFNESLQASLGDFLETVPADVVSLTADHTLSLEGLTDEDVLVFVREIALEVGQEEN